MIQKILSAKNSRRGEVATTLTLISLGLMTLGTLFGTLAVRSGPLSTQTKAAGDWWMEVFSTSSYPSLKQTQVEFSVSRDGLASGTETVAFFIRHDGENAKYFKGGTETGTTRDFGIRAVDTKVGVWLNWSQTYIDEGCLALSGLAYGFSSNRLGKKIVNYNFSLPGLGAQCPGAAQPTATPTPTATPAAALTPTPTVTESPTAPWQIPVNFRVNNNRLQSVELNRIVYSLQKQVGGGAWQDVSPTPPSPYTWPSRTVIDADSSTNFTITLQNLEAGISYRLSSELTYLVDSQTLKKISDEGTIAFDEEDTSVTQTFTLAEAVAGQGHFKITVNTSTVPNRYQACATDIECRVWVPDPYGYFSDTQTDELKKSYTVNQLVYTFNTSEFTNLPDLIIGKTYQFECGLIAPVGTQSTRMVYSSDKEQAVLTATETNIALTPDTEKYPNRPDVCPEATMPPPPPDVISVAASISYSEPGAVDKLRFYIKKSTEVTPFDEYTVDHPTSNTNYSHNFGNLDADQEYTVWVNARKNEQIVGRIEMVECTGTAGLQLNEPACKEMVPGGSALFRITLPLVTVTPIACPTLVQPQNVQIVFESGSGCTNAIQAVGLATGDVNGDGVVNTIDLMLFMNFVGTEKGQKGYKVSADVNNDTVVNGLDGSLMLKLVGR